jgi:DNA-3-methyladenine glycosylase II
MPAAAQAIDPFGDVSPALRALSKRDAGLKRAIAAIKHPHIRRREGGFEGLFRIIVEQQVSVPSAQAIWKRVGDGLDRSCPVSVGRAGESGLCALGLSRPKARYVTALAEAARDGGVSFDTLGSLPDDAAAESLIALKGVGPWTAAIYLLFCEGRVDIWPPNDVALLRAYEAASGEDCTQKTLDTRAAAWAPHRGIAAHCLWTYYAHLKGRTPI